MSDIWDEKPEPTILESIDPDFLTLKPRFYQISKMDAWLEKLRAETRRAMEWMACIDALNLTYGIAEIMSWKEKAQKWDKYTLDGASIIPEIIEAIEEAEKKLEAVNKFREELRLEIKAKLYQTTKQSILRRLDDILEVKNES